MQYSSDLICILVLIFILSPASSASAESSATATTRVWTPRRISGVAGLRLKCPWRLSDTRIICQMELRPESSVSLYTSFLSFSLSLPGILMLNSRWSGWVVQGTGIRLSSPPCRAGSGQTAACNSTWDFVWVTYIMAPFIFCCNLNSTFFFFSPFVSPSAWLPALSQILDNFEVLEPQPWEFPFYMSTVQHFRAKPF